MKTKYQLFFVGRVGEARIETNNLQSYKMYRGNVMVSIHPAKTTRDYSTNGLLYETD
jgi:hypothetical protein